MKDTQINLINEVLFFNSKSWIFNRRSLRFELNWFNRRLLWDFFSRVSFLIYLWGLGFRWIGTSKAAPVEFGQLIKCIVYARFTNERSFLSASELILKMQTWIVDVIVLRRFFNEVSSAITEKRCWMTWVLANCKFARFVSKWTSGFLLVGYYVCMIGLLSVQELQVQHLLMN